MSIGRIALVLLGALLAAALLGACDDPEARRQERRERVRDSIRLAWVVQHPRWGREALFLERLPEGSGGGAKQGGSGEEGGRLRYVLDPPERGGARVRAALDLSAEEVGQLKARLRRLGACDLRSGREALDQNESRPTLSLRFSDLRCEPELYFGEWREGEAAPVHALIETLKARVRAQGS